ncbi:nucleotidyltransferase domain-containing protein, partial [Pseudomonas sp. HMWF032]|uniref:PD-(D/E)XK nuclease domain-containing protein n=1 Tax=Pseudomonas sp. HMWF032 TaxID=2056866 RepID=UPI001C44A263
MYEEYQSEIDAALEEENVDVFFINDLGVIVDYFSAIEKIYLFGSRRYPHQSLRSDLDLLFITSDYIRPTDLRSVIHHTPILDIFTVSGGVAISCANESYIAYATEQELLERLDAVLIWERSSGFIQNSGIKPFFKFRSDVEFKMTTMPSSFYKADSYDKKLREIENSGLPISPLIGEDVSSVALFLISVAGRMIFDKKMFSKSRGQAKDSWVTNLESEYDFQDLFEITCRPFIPNMSREEVSIIYDGSKKLSDFSFFDSQIIIEMKYIKSTGEASNTVKTLSG